MTKQKFLIGVQLVCVLIAVLLTCFVPVSLAEVDPNCDLIGLSHNRTWDCCLYADGAPIPEGAITYNPDDNFSSSVVRGGLKQTQQLLVRAQTYASFYFNTESSYLQRLQDVETCLDMFIAADPANRQGADQPCLPLPETIPNGAKLRFLYNEELITWINDIDHGVPPFDLDHIEGTTTYAKRVAEGYEIVTFAIAKKITCVDNTIDSDGDGINDCADNCPFSPNPDQSPCSGYDDGVDIDGDGFGRCIDNCPYMANPDQLDVNLNGIGDLCECDLILEPDKTIVPPEEEVVIINSGQITKDKNIIWTIETEEGLELNEETGKIAKEITLSAISGQGYATITGTMEDNPDCFDTTQIYFGCLTCAEGMCEVSGGSGGTALRSIDTRISLGREKNGISAGEIVLRADAMSAALSTPDALKVFLNGDSWMVAPNGNITEINSREVCAKFSVIDDTEYEIRFYAADPDSSEWQYAFLHKVPYDPPSDDIIAAWRVEKTSSSSLKVTYQRGGTIKVSTYVWNEATATWSLAKGDNTTTVQTLSKAETTDGNGNPVETETVKDGAGTTSSVVRTTYKNITCGSVSKRVEIERVVDPDNAALTTVTDYYEQGEPACTAGNCGLIEKQIHADGSWARYEYDSRSRKTKEVRSWLDQPVTADESAVRVTTYDYSPITGADDTEDPEYDFEPRIVTETIEGKVVSRQFTVFQRDNVNQVVTQISETATTPTAAYGDPANRRTITVSYLPGTSPTAGKIKEQTNPDNTRDTYTYEAGTYAPAHPSLGTFTPGPGRDLRVIVTHGTTAAPGGIADKTTREVSIRDYYGKELERQAYVCTGAGYDLLSWSVMAYDANGRLTDTWNADGTHSSSVWNCCHQESETDIYGLVTAYTGYDALGRLLSSVNNNITTTTTTYDGSGRRLSQTISGGGLSLTSQNTYDPAGRLDTAVDTAGLTTGYDYTDNGRTTTVIRPGGATEITTSYLDGRAKSVAGTAATPRYYTYGVNADGTRWTRVDMGAQPSPRYEITTTDMAGNVIRTEKPGYAGPEVTAGTYDALGRLIASSAPGLADSLYEYDELGNLIRSGLDVNANGHLDDASPDRIQESSTSYAYEDGAWWQKAVSKIYAVDNSATPVTTGVQKTRLTGLGANGLIQESVSTDINGNPTVSRTTVSPSTKTVTQTVDYPDSANNEITTTVNGLTASHQSRTGVVTTFSYDGLGRRTGVIDPRTGTSVTHYDTLGRVDYVRDPAGHQTTYTYDPATGRRTAETSPAGKTTRYAYNNLGQVTHKWGTAVEPVAFDYDAYGQMTHMNLYRSGTGWDSAAWPTATAGDPDTTAWGYQEATGLLTSKTDDAGKATTYTYTDGGKLHTRTWARQNGALVTTYGYDPATGELTFVDYTDATPDVTYTYTRAGQPATVSDAAGTRTFAYASDLQLNTETMTGLYNKTITRNYETSGVVGRATGFSLPGYSVAYGYDPATGRFKDLTWNTGAGTKTAAYAYVANSDILDTVTTGSLVTDFAYEPLRNVKTRVKHTFGGAGIVQYDYTYDPSGRRDHMDMTPDLPNAVVPTATAYTPNNLNQYETLTKNGTTDTPAYDEDGNLVSSSLIPAMAAIQSVRAFTWDAENRLTAVSPQTPAEGDKKVAFVYDYMGRRVKKDAFTFTSGAWSPAFTTLFVYDGWNLIQELDGAGAVQKAYAWGLDLSQSLQGAGGVGGLLAMAEGGNTYLYCHDANGNVGRMVNAADGVVAAAYEYAPFGGLIHKSGSGGMEDKNPFRFSTKYWDSETGLYYYGYRYYEPGVGRWMSRDPKQEDGSKNLYAFVDNSPISKIDLMGLKAWEACELLTADHLHKYQNFVENFSISTFPVVDCADTPLFLLMKFAETEKLILKFESNGVNANSDEKRFNNFSQFFGYMGSRIHSSNIHKYGFDVSGLSKGAGDFYYREPFSINIPFYGKIEIKTGHVLTLKSSHWWDIFAGSYDTELMAAIKPEMYTWLGKENTDAELYEGILGYMLVQRSWLHGPYRWKQFNE